MRRRWSPASKAMAVLAVAFGLGAFGLVRGYAARLEALRPAVGRPTAIVVAARDLPRGTVLEPSMLRPDRVPEAFRPPGAIAEPKEAIGRTLVAPLGQGETITGTRLAVARAGPVGALVPPGLRAFTVSAALLPGSVRPGDRVDVLATFGGPRPYTETVAMGLEVMLVADGPETGTAIGPASAPSGGGLVLLVSPETAERLAYASAFASLSVAIAPADGVS